MRACSHRFTTAAICCNLVVQTRCPKKAEELVKEGAVAALSSGEVAEKSSVIFTLASCVGRDPLTKATTRHQPQPPS